MSEEKGRVSKIAGPVVDVAFPLDALPELNYALEVDVEVDGETNTIVLEVAQHLGEGKIRAISMQGTDGLRRGAEVTNTGAPISVPVGQATLGHIFNVYGRSLDVPTDSLDIKERWPIHRNPPDFHEQATEIEMLEMGIKVMDLIAPFTRGG